MVSRKIYFVVVENGEVLTYTERKLSAGNKVFFKGKRYEIKKSSPQMKTKYVIFLDNQKKLKLPMKESKHSESHKKQKIIIKENKKINIKKAKIPESIIKDLEFSKPKYSKLRENSIFHLMHKNKPAHYFMYHPKRRELLVSSENAETKCHADLHSLHSTVQFNIPTDEYGFGGYKNDYDDFVRGAFGITNKLKDGLIEFHSSTEGWKENPKLFDDVMDTLEVFKLNGANENTVIKRLDFKMETMKQFY